MGGHTPQVAKGLGIQHEVCHLRHAGRLPHSEQDVVEAVWHTLGGVLALPEGVFVNL